MSKKVVFITTPKNWGKLVSNDGVWPVKNRCKNMANEIVPGTEVLVYNNRISSFVAIIRILDTLKSPNSNILFNEDIYENFFCFDILVSLEKNDSIKIKEMLNDLNFIKGKKKWGVILQKSLMCIDDHDYNLIYEKIMSRYKECFQCTDLSPEKSACTK